jgi:pyrroline-5-carboxylate reductase
MTSKIAFIGGGNMASAIIGGLLRQGRSSKDILVVEPFAQSRQRLIADFGVAAIEQPDTSLAQANLVVWAVKPQTFCEAAAAAGPHTRQALHLSVAAGIRSDSISRWTGCERIVRCMPNTPALVGQGMTGLFARPGVSASDRSLVEQVIATTGQWLWVDQESQLDAVTALSGSGPAYVFYFLEAMTEAGTQMGLTSEQALKLSIGTFAGASALALSATEPPEVLRQQVTSKGGTTYAAISAMQECQIGPNFVAAMEKARVRAVELGNEFGADCSPT